MKLTDIQAKISEIKEKATSRDYEVPHMLEDQLYLKFIQHVAEKGSPTLKAMAAECLKTQDIDMQRWFA